MLTFVLAGVLAGAACGENKPAPLRNYCADDRDCAADARCKREVSHCFALKTSTPYSLVLQATTQTASAGEVARHTFPVFELGASDNDHDLTIPIGLSLQGTVGVDNEGDTRAVKSQLLFKPNSEPGLPVAAITASSRARLDEQGQNFSVTLTPNTMYRVTVYPLGQDSTRYPPLVTELDSSKLAADSPVTFMYSGAGLETFRGFLIDEKGVPLTGHWVRIIDLETRDVVSSIGVVGELGELKLSVNPNVLANKAYIFEIDLDDQNAWATVIEADHTHIDPAKDNTITIPVIPNYVRFQGTVDKSSEIANLSSTDLTFVSEFPVPNVPGEVGGRDFCRATLPSDTKSPFRCHSTRQGTTDDEGRFNVALLPGDYRVFLSPNRDSQNVDRATTQATTAVIETQPGDAPQQGQLYMLATGSRYRGAVRAKDGEPLDNVLVRAVALGLPGYLGEVATYNRTSEAVSGREGAFELPVDVGYYDLVARPAASIGFPWMYVPNQAIGVQKETINVAGFVLPTPLLLAGTLAREGGKPQGSASVDAYALVQGFDGGRRAVLIGQTLTDAEGHYSLLLTSQVRSLDMPPQIPDAGAE